MLATQVATWTTWTFWACNCRQPFLCPPSFGLFLTSRQWKICFSGFIYHLPIWAFAQHITALILQAHPALRHQYRCIQVPRLSSFFWAIYDIQFRPKNIRFLVREAHAHRTFTHYYYLMPCHAATPPPVWFQPFHSSFRLPFSLLHRHLIMTRSLVNYCSTCKYLASW